MSICWRSLTWSFFIPIENGPVSGGKVACPPPVVVVPPPPLVVVPPPTVVVPPDDEVPPEDEVVPPPLEVPPLDEAGGGDVVCAWVVTEIDEESAEVFPAAS